MTRKRLGLILGFSLLAVAIGLAIFRSRTAAFSFAAFGAALRHVDWRWLVTSQTMMLATYLGRALRWQVMLRPVKKDASLWRILSATVIGFTMIMLFGRAGEPVRPYLIAKNEGVSFSSQVAAWVLERILDLMMVLLIFGLALTRIAATGIHPGPKIQIALQTAGYTAGSTAIVCLALLIVLRGLTETTQGRILKAISSLPQAVTSRAERLLKAFSEGASSTRTASNAILLVAYSGLEWGIITLGIVFLFRAFPGTAALSLSDIIIFLGFVNFGSVLQLPGVGGGLQIAAVLVLTELFGISVEIASGFALVLWLVSFVTIVPVGLVLALHEGVKLSSLRDLKT